MTRGRKIRRSQLIQQFGVGAIYDYDGESLVACDTSKWMTSWGTPHGDEINLWRLAKSLEVDCFYSPPIAPSSRGPTNGDEQIDPRKTILFERFPKWLFCSNSRCEKLQHYVYQYEDGDLPKCISCKSKLVPVRFVQICPQGHLQDVPWDYWLHQCCSKNEKQKNCNHKTHLKWSSGSKGGGSLYNVVITCDKCGAKGTIGDLKNLPVLPWKCKGRQPWQTTDHECNGCRVNGERAVKVTQRGAANVWHGEVKSALDIPPAALWINRSNETEWGNNREFVELLTKARTDENWRDGLRPFIDQIAFDYDQDTQVIIDDIASRLRSVQANEETIETVDDLRRGEFNALCNPPEQHDVRDDFIAEVTDLTTVSPDEFGRDAKHAECILSSIECVTVARRIREVRALCGFSREDPGNPLIPPDLTGDLGWLPAVEVFGEGIFVAFKERFITDWIDDNENFINQRIQGMQQRHTKSMSAEWLPAPSPRLVALHTLAHLMLRQLSFECGYGSSSLKEIVYHSDGPKHPMAGVLIHTTENDSEGSLGGLAEQGDPRRLISVMITAIRRSQWCSNDPICSEMPCQGRDGLNKAACHACALVAETSCQYGNVLLDRQLLIQHNGLFPSFASTI